MPAQRSSSFTLTHDKQTHEHGLLVQHVTVKDRYTKRRYSVERALFRALTNTLQQYLAKNPDVHFTRKRNVARTIVYLPAGIKAWSAYMPGGFATHPVHNPETKQLAHGQKIDFMTRRLFRHSTDAIGLRNRAYILAWVVSQHASKDAVRHWLSIAAGSGQHVYDALTAIGARQKYNVILTDRDEEVLDFARKLYEIEKPALKSINFIILDALDPSPFGRLIAAAQPSVIDAMGLIEYLTVFEAAGLIGRLYESLAPGGILVFTNMSTHNPHLDLHQRGLGWPGVIPRTVETVASIIETAKILLESVTVYRSQDKVYNVYVITKSFS